jgi:hypothetical protein
VDTSAICALRPSIHIYTLLITGWRPSVGYKPVDTSAIDALRPLHQRKMIELVNRRQQMEQAEKKEKVSRVYVCMCVCKRLYMNW